jgi:hypothetical protein
VFLKGRSALRHSFNGKLGVVKMYGAGVFLAAVASSCLAAGWIDTPDSIALQNVGDEIRLNGTPMKIRSFTSNQPLEQVIKQFQDNWESGNKVDKVSLTKMNEWTVLNQTIGEGHRSVQAKESGNGLVEGYVALTSPLRTREPKLKIRMPSDVKILSVVESAEQGRSSQQVTAVSDRSMDGAANSIEGALRQAGWSVRPRQKKPNATRISADKSEQEFDAIVSPANTGAMLMMNTVFQGQP